MSSLPSVFQRVRSCSALLSRDSWSVSRQPVNRGNGLRQVSVVIVGLNCSLSGEEKTIEKQSARCSLHANEILTR